MKKILETLRLKWSEYLLEIVVIMIGILGAFMLNNWNENAKARKLESEILYEIKLNIERDNDDHQQNFYFLENSISSLEIILNHIKLGLPYSDSLSENFMWIFQLPDFNPITSGYERLATGSIRNDSLRMEISFLYGNTHKWIFDKTSQIRDQSLRELKNYLIPKLEGYKFETYTIGDINRLSEQRARVRAVPHSYEGLVHDEKLISLLEYHRSRLEFFYFHYKRRINNSQKIIELIDKIK